MRPFRCVKIEADRHLLDWLALGFARFFANAPNLFPARIGRERPQIGLRYPMISLPFLICHANCRSDEERIFAHHTGDSRTIRWRNVYNGAQTAPINGKCSISTPAVIFTSRILEGLMERRGLVEPREGVDCWLGGFSPIRT